MKKETIEEELSYLDHILQDLLATIEVPLDEAFEAARTITDKCPDDNWEEIAVKFGFVFPALVSITRCRDILNGDPGGILDEGHEAASYWLCRAIADTWAAWGFAGMNASEEAAKKRAISEVARKANAVRHNENRELSTSIMAWYEQNAHKYKSMDKAAEAAMKLVPVSFRTARKHIGEVSKKMRSARKA